MKIFKCEGCYRTAKRLDGCMNDPLKCVVCNGKMNLTTKKDALADVPLQCGVMCDGYFKGITEEAIKILGEYLPPDGVDAHETLSRLLGLFDNEEIVKKLANT